MQSKTKNNIGQTKHSTENLKIRVVHVEEIIKVWWQNRRIRSFIKSQFSKCFKHNLWLVISIYPSKTFNRVGLEKQSFFLLIPKHLSANDKNNLSWNEKKKCIPRNWGQKISSHLYINIWWNKLNTNYFQKRYLSRKHSIRRKLQS